MFAELFVVSPHPDDFYRLNVIHDLTDKSVLDIDPAGTCSRQVAHQSFIWWRRLVGILGEIIQ